jgi:hypothetical protein
MKDGIESFALKAKYVLALIIVLCIAMAALQTGPALSAYTYDLGPQTLMGVQAVTTIDIASAEYIKGQVEVLGKTLRLPVSIAENPGLVAIQLEITYDDSIFKVKDVQPGPAYNPSWILNAGTSGIINIVGASLQQWHANGIIIIVEFEVDYTAADGEYPIALDIRVLTTLDAQFNQVDIPRAKTDGAVTVSSVVRGDVDGDGELRARDALELLMIIAELKQPTERQRIAGKLTALSTAPISVRDVTEILLIVAELKPPPPQFG